MIDAVILAGGEGRRMGGSDKGLMELSGKPLVSWVIDALKRQTRSLGHVLVSANRNLADYARYGYPVLRDVYPGQVGALAGIHAALMATPSEYLLAVPCDIPFLPHDLLEKLFVAMQSGNTDVVFARSGSELPYTAVCLIRHRALAGLTERLASQEYRLGGWYAAINALPVDFPPGSLGDLSTIEDVAGMATRLAGVETIPVGGELSRSTRAEVRVVGGGTKDESLCIGRAEGEIRIMPDTLQKIENDGQKCDALGMARAAGLLAAKKTADLIPLCPQGALNNIEVDFELDRARGIISCRVVVEAVGCAIVEMAAMTAVSVALLSIFDMFKTTDRSMSISGVRLAEKEPSAPNRWLIEDGEIRL